MPKRPKDFPAYIKTANKCGKLPKLRDWQNLDTSKLTTGERVLRFAADYLCFGEGPETGKPLILAPFQQAFVLAAFDDTGEHISSATLSVGRRSGKSLVLAVIMLAYLIGPLTRQNAVIASAAMTRDQAAILFRLMNLILQSSVKVSGLWRAVPSSKKLFGLNKNVEYRSLSRDAGSNLGVAFLALVIDEAGSIAAANDDFLDAVLSSMGTYDDARVFNISTQAPSDMAYFSNLIDSAHREQPDNAVVHLYTAPTDEIDNRDNWYAAQPSLHNGYRSLEDIERNAKDALRIPAKQNGFLLYFLNRRTSMEALWLAPSVWKENNAQPDWSVFEEEGVHVGLDLATMNDLCVAAISAKDSEGVIHSYPYAFTPMSGIEERSQRDKVPYDAWARDGVVTAVPGKTINYDFVAQFLRMNLLDAGIPIKSIEFDRWRIKEFKAACDRQGVNLPEQSWHEVGQGFKDMSPRISAMETALLKGKIAHGAHPVYNLGAASAVVTRDHANNGRLDKTKASHKIDGVVAMLMSCYPLIVQTDAPEVDIMTAFL